jgi:hypothetical protein
MCVAVGAATQTQAQTQTPEDISKQLEVTRAYTPRVGQAVKLPVEPDMTDTVRLRPAISYRITSTASDTSFDTRPFAPAAVSTVPLDARRLYVRAGAGVPFRSALDLYFTPQMRAGRTFGLFANHSGSWSRLTNDLGVKSSARELYNGIGLWGTRQTGRDGRYTLAGELTFDHRVFDPYGAADIEPDPLSSVPYVRGFVYDRDMHRIAFGRLGGGVSFGDSFTDLSKFNFGVKVDGGIARVDRDDQYDLNLRLVASQMFGRDDRLHGFELAVAERGAFGPAMYGVDGDVRWPGSATTVTFAPRYLMEAGALSMRVGVDVRHIGNKAHGQNHVGLTPSFEARLNFADGGVVPFVSYTSSTIDNSREALSRRNPYAVGTGATSLVSDARVGVSGTIGGIFSYRLAGGVSLMDDYVLLTGRQRIVPMADGGGLVGDWGADGEVRAVGFLPMIFDDMAVDGTRYTVGGEVGLKGLGGFGARVYGNWNKFVFSGLYYDGFVPVGDLPRYDAGVELSYRHGDVVSVRAGARLIGEREYTVWRSGPFYGDELYVPAYGLTYDVVGAQNRRIESTVDVSLAVDVKVRPDFWVFVEGQNLANQALYPYPTYRGLGAGVMGGVKIVF